MSTSCEHIIFDKSIINQYEPTGFAWRLITAAKAMDLPYVLWKLPQENELHLIIDLSERQKVNEPDLENLREGFILAPFENKTLGNYFIHADLHLKIISGQVIESKASLEYGSQVLKNKLDLFELVNKGDGTLEGEGGTNAKESFFLKKENTSTVENGHFDQAVGNAVEQIQQGVFQKVVLSRKKAVAWPEGFDPFKSFLALSEKFTNAFVSLASVPEVGTWLGASPETLIQIKEGHEFKTVALAGTQGHDPDIKLSHVAWRQKEIEEQALVSRYIINCFKKIRLREFDEIGPKTVVAGSLVHLRTDFMVDMKATNFPQLGTVMLELLHPTSAVCGMPKDSSKNFILEHEGYDRELYSGFLGPVNMEQSTHIFVNLRCMQVCEDSLVFYAGAGITEDSEPESEFLETEMKMDVLFKTIFPNPPNV